MRRIRPTTTLFLLTSVDGKISTGDNDQLDFDQDLPNIPGVREGLHQYYDLEKQTDLVSLNTGRVMAKIGVNTKPFRKTKLDCQFVIIDNKPHLTAKGLKYLTSWVSHLYLATDNSHHPAYKLKDPNITIIPTKHDPLPELFKILWSKYKIKRLTIQSGGTLNTELIRAGLIDYISLVIAPLIVGGKNTSSIADGASLFTKSDLAKICPVKLLEAKQLNSSYILLRYEVQNKVL